MTGHDDNTDDPYDLARLAAARQHARGMGGAERIARQHAAGRLSARERIAALLDEGTAFEELGLLAHSDREPDRASTPADGKITGYGRIGGRAVYVAADDVTVKAGAYGRVGHHKAGKAVAYAMKKGFPSPSRSNGSSR